MEPAPAIGLSIFIPLCVAALTHVHTLDNVLASFDEMLFTRIAALSGALGLSSECWRRLTDAESLDKTQ
jgi:hypothetical protein